MNAGADDSSSNKSRTTISALRWTGVEEILLRLIQFAVSIVIARMLLPSDYGLIAMTGVFIAVATTFVDGGMTNALVRKVNASLLDYSTVFIYNFVISISVYIVIYICAPFISDFYNQPILVTVIRVIGLNIMIGAVGAVHNAYLTSQLKFNDIAKASVSSSMISGAVGIILALYGFGVWALAIQSVVRVLLTTVVILLVSRLRFNLRFSISSFRELFGYGNKLLLSGLLHTIYSQASALIIGKFFNPKSLGLYVRGEQFPSTIQSVMCSPVSRVAFPVFARVKDDRVALLTEYKKFIRTLSVPVIFSLLLLSALARPVVTLLLTDRWIMVVPYLQIFCFTYLTEHVCTLNLNLLQVIGRSDIFLKLEIIKKVISIILLIAAVPFGVLAMCVSRLVYSQIALLINLTVTSRVFRLSIWKQIMDYIPYLLISIVSVCPAFLSALIIENDWISLPLGTLVSVMVYYVILLMRGDKSIYYLKKFAGSCG